METTGLTCRELMLKDDNAIPPETTVAQAFHLIRQKGVRYLPVVNASGIYLGVFTSASLIKLLLPRALTIDLAGMDTDRSLQNLAFYSMNTADFHQRIADLEDETVDNYLSDPKSIPVTAPDTPIMEGILLLHKFKRHVILAEPESHRYVGVLTINSVLGSIFD